jgi:hypothetical protein
MIGAREELSLEVEEGELPLGRRDEELAAEAY